MDVSAIYESLTETFQDIFDDDALALRPELTANEVDGWDSLSHVRMILAVEQKFKIRFSASQVSSLANVGELVKLIEVKVKAA